jgi:hypothetical protein
MYSSSITMPLIDANSVGFSRILLQSVITVEPDVCFGAVSASVLVRVPSDALDLLVFTNLPLSGGFEVVCFVL